MCSLAFFAFLRIGELTMTTSNNQPLQMHQLSHIYDTNNQITGIKLTFENSKHNYNQRHFSLEIYRQSMVYPVQLLSDYLVLRGSRPGVGVKRGNGTERTGGTGMAEPEKRVKRGKEGKTRKRG
jgi:hypothetical protein